MTFRYRSKISLLTCLFLQTTICGFAQLINGQVVDFATRKPIMYVNIGILGSSVGTISNDDGTFSIEVPSEYSEASVIFSMLGYEPREIPVQRLVDQIRKKSACENPSQRQFLARKQYDSRPDSEVGENEHALPAYQRCVAFDLFAYFSVV